MLAGAPAAFVRADVSLGGEPVIGSFTVDGLTFAVTEGSSVELVGVSPDRQQVASSQEGEGSPVAPMPASGADGLGAGGPAAVEAESDGPALTLPESVSFEGAAYDVASIGAYAFYLSGVASVELPASVEQVDERAFRSSDVAAVEVADGNQSCSSFDGALYSADYSRLLLIPEGKQGAVRMPSAVVAALPSAFSHCAGVDAISVDAGGAAFASENGLLYDASLTTLIRVPAGATDITIRDSCTAIAAGAMEGCAQLTSITAPASVTSVSPDVFASVPTVSLPAASAVADDPDASTGATEEPSEQARSTPASSPATTQLTAMVALSSTDDDLPEVDPAAIEVHLPEGVDDAPWVAIGFSVEEGAGLAASAPMLSSEVAPAEEEPVEAVAASDDPDGPVASLGAASTYDASYNIGLVVLPGSDGGYHGTIKLEEATSGVYQNSDYEIGMWGLSTPWFACSVSEGKLTITVYYASSGGSIARRAVISGAPEAGYFFAGFADNASGLPAWYATGPSGSSMLNGSIWQIQDLNDPSTPNVAHLYAVFTPFPTYGVYSLDHGKIRTTKSITNGIVNTTVVEGTFGGTLRTTYPRWTVSLGASGTFAVTIYRWETGADVMYYQEGQVVPDPGYKFAGWSESESGANPSATNIQAGATNHDGYVRYAVFSPLSYAVSFNANGGSGGQTANVTATYDASMPTIATTAPTRAGYIFMGWYDNADYTKGTQYYTASGASAHAWNKTRAATVYAGWKQRPVSTVNLYMDEAMTELYRTVYVWYEVGWYDTPTPTESTAQLTTIGTPERLGYAYYGFRGTTSTGAQGTWWKDVTVFPALKSATLAGATTAKTTDLYAVWTPVVAADVPLEVTATVDLLDAEGQVPARGYIESRSGGTLQVAQVDFTPLAGAADLFGARTADVALEALAGGEANASVRFALDGAASESDASALSSFQLPTGYGSRLAVAYRFAIPQDVLAAIDPVRFEQVTTPVCAVAYTVALA